jgi:uncharacterized protein YjbI with pentapeptide repeats
VGARIRGIAEFSGARFESSADFSRLHIEGDALFNSVKSARVSFAADANFSNMVVDGVAEFSADEDGNSAQFEGDASFNHTRFGPLITFDRAQFKKKAEFDGMRVDGSAVLRADFQGATSMISVRIQAQAVFDGAHFGGPAAFDDLRVDGPILFNAGEDGKPISFDSRATFSGAIFKGFVEFIRVEFKGGVEFSATRMESDASFEYSKFYESAVFSGAYIRNAKFRPDITDHIPDGRAQFYGTVDFRGFSYEQISVAWNELFDRLSPYDRQVYIRFEEYLRETGDDRAANRVYISRRLAERRQMALTDDRWGQFSDGLYRVVANYGVRPFRLIGYTLVLLALGTWIFLPTGSVTLRKDAAELPSRNQDSWSVFDAFGVSLHQLLPIEIPLGSQWQPSDKPQHLNMMVAGRTLQIGTVRPSFVATILRIAGWILAPLALAAVTGVLRRARQ